MTGATQARFTLETADYVAGLPPITWLVEGLLPEQSFGLLYGVPGEGKSFVALDLAFSVAAGVPWHGREVRQGAVIYIVAEGSRGMATRTAAWKKAHGLDQLPEAFFVRSPVQMHQRQDVNALVNAIQSTGIKPALIVIDTLAQCFVGGDENAAQSMGAWVDGVRRIQTSLETAVLAVHHASKKKGARERGSGALVGAVDMTMRLEKTGDTAVTLTCEKQKEAERFKPIALQLTPLALGPEVSSMIVRGGGSAALGDAALSASETAVLGVLKNSPEPLRPKAIRELAGISESSVHRALLDLVQKGQAQKLGTGVYTVRRPTAEGGLADDQPTAA